MPYYLVKATALIQADNEDAAVEKADLDKMDIQCESEWESPEHYYDWLTLKRILKQNTT